MAKNITIYTTNTCASCATVKRYLDAKGHTYEVVNLDEQPDQRQKVIEISGAQTVPVIVVENGAGTPNITVGWNPGKLAAALAG